MKIFGIGYHKTGTLSLHKALERLGFLSRHGYKPQSDLVENALRDKKPALTYLEDTTQKRGVGVHDAYLDMYAIRNHYAVLSNQYHDAKFILTTRDEESWVKSVRKQREFRHDTPFFHYWYYQTEDQWTHEKALHEHLVKRFFMGTENLLIMNIIEGDGYEKLCPFLGVDVPNEAFPHANKTKDK